MVVQADDWKGDAPDLIDLDANHFDVGLLPVGLQFATLWIAQLQRGSSEATFDSEEVADAVELA